MGENVLKIFIIYVLLLLLPIFSAAAESPGKDSASRPPSTTKETFLLFWEEKDLYTATKRAMPLHKAPAIASVITADEIRDMGARDLLDILKLATGFGISLNEFGSSMVEVRGIRTSLNEKILLMIDGHSLNKNINGSSLYHVAETLPVEDIKQVEVVRGPGSALYGNSALVATINVITRDAAEIKGLEVKAGGGSFDTYQGNLVGGKTFGDKLDISGSLDHYRTRGPELRVETDVLSGTPFSRAPGTAELGLEQTDAFLKIVYGDLSFRGHYLTKQKNLYIGIASALTDASSKNRPENYWGELAYVLRLAAGLSSNLKLRYDYYEQDPNVKILPDGFGGSFPEGMIGRPQVKDRTIGVEQQVDWDVFRGNHLIAGASYEVMRQYDVRHFANFNPMTGAFIGPIQEVANWNMDANRHNWSLYLQDEWQAPEKVNLTAGVRYDHYGDFGGTVNPRAGLVWNFLENADLKLLYGQAFRAPNFVELYDINNPVVAGNPGLGPERTKTYEAGLAYRLNRFFAVDLNYFYSTIDGLIIFDTSTSPARFANAGNSRTQGVETGLSGAYGVDFSWKLTYAWQDPRDSDTGQRLPFVPSRRATASANYAVTRYLNLHSDILWTGERPRPEGDSRAAAPSYTTVDLAATVGNFWKNWEIQAAVHNVFDKRFFDPDTSGAQNKVPGDFPREGISALLSATYKF